MRMDKQGHVYPPYRLRADRALASKYLQAQSAPVDLGTVPLTYMIFLRGEAQGVPAAETKLAAWWGRR